MLPKPFAREPVDLRKLQLKSALQDDLACSPNVGAQVIVIGDTSSGKSTTVNFILGYPSCFYGQGIATRRPCIITMMPGATQEQDTSGISFFCKFEHKRDLLTSNVKDVANYVKDANDFGLHPKWFRHSNARDAFDLKPVYVEMRGDFRHALRLLDLPGLTRDSEEPMKIAQSYLQHAQHVPVLVLGTEDVANGGFPLLAEKMRHCRSPVVIQNFATEQCRKGSAKKNYEEIRRILNHERFVFCCVDFGLPFGAVHWVHGKDQGDYLKDSGDPARVQEEMFKHEADRARELEQKYCQDEAGFSFGLQCVRAKLEMQATSDLDSTIAELREGVQEEQERVTRERDQLQKHLSNMQCPPEWSKFLGKITMRLRSCVDGTLVLEGSGQSTKEELLQLQSSDTGPLAISAAAALQSSSTPTSNGARMTPTVAEPDVEVGMNVCSPSRWIDAETDQAIREELVAGGFQPDSKLRGLPSWYRLLDELTGVLAFAPMPVITKSEYSQLFGGVGSGPGATISLLDNVVEHVLKMQTRTCQGLTGKATSMIVSLLHTWQWRFQLLLRRDIEAAIARCRQEANRKDSDIRECLRLLGVDDEETREMVLKRVEDVLKETTAAKIQAVVKELCQTDPLRKDGAPRWILPFKAHHMNEQIGTCNICFEDSSRPTEHPANKIVRDLMWIAMIAAFILAVLSRRGSVIEHIARLHFTGVQLLKLLSIPFACTLIMLLKKETRVIVVFVISCMPFLCWFTPQTLVMVASVFGFGFGLGRCTSVRGGCKSSAQQVNKCSHDEVHRHGLNVNAFNSINLDIFQRATRCREFSIQGSLELQGFDEETYRLLFAVQHELAEAFATAYKGFIQRLSSKEVKLQIKQPGLAAAVDSVTSWFGEQDESNNSAEIWDFKEEVNKCPDLWPMYDTKDGYIQVVEAAAQAFRNSSKALEDKFLSQLADKLFGPPSWFRLSQEFLFVLAHMRMPSVDQQEVDNCKRGSGVMIRASCEDVVSKLVMRRLEERCGRCREVFILRMMQLLKRDAQFARQAAAREGKVEPGLLVEAEQLIVQHAEHVLREAMQQLVHRLDELFPLDRTMENGRIGIAQTKLRKDTYDPITGQRRNSAQPTRPGGGDRAAPLRLRYGSASGQPIVELRSALAFYVAFSRESELKLEMVIHRPHRDHPYNDMNLAGGEFHEVALKVHKSFCIDAIRYVRPRLRKAIAVLSNEESLLDMIHGHPKLDYRQLFGVERMREQLEAMQQRLCRLAEHLAEYARIYGRELAGSAEAAMRETLLGGLSFEAVDVIRPEDSVTNVAMPFSASSAYEQGSEFGTYATNNDWSRIIAAPHAPEMYDLDPFASSACNEAESIALSTASSGSSGHCFLGDTIFRTPTRALVPASRLRPGSQIVGSKGSVLTVRSVKTLPVQPQALVRLRTAEASLTVTASHRVVAEREGKECTLPAGALQKTDLVYCSDRGPCELLEASSWEENVAVVALYFSPDEPVEAFPAQRAILTMGQRQRAGGTRRSGMNRRERPQQQDDLTSIPDTMREFSE